MTIENGGPAFPYNETGDCGIRPGMTLLDYFAAEVLPVVYTDRMMAWRNGEQSDGDNWRFDITMEAYGIAAAMLEVRKKYV